MNEQPRHGVPTRVALTETQRILWSQYKMYPGLPGNAVPRRLQWNTEIDPESFRRAFEVLVERTDSLRLIFGELEGEPWQTALKEAAGHLQVADFSDRSDPDGSAHRWLDALGGQVFDLSKSCFNAALIKLAPQRWLFFINQHHIATDFTSIAILVRRLERLYRQALEGEIPPAGPFPSFVDFLADHPEMSEPAIPVRRHARPAELFGLEPSHAPSPRRRAELLVGAERLGRIRSFCGRESRTGGTAPGMFDVLATAYAALILRAVGTEAVTIGTVSANRYLAGADDVAGALIRLVPLRIDTAAGGSFQALLETVAADRRRVFDACREGAPIEPLSCRCFFNYLPFALPDLDGVPSEDITRHESGIGSGLDLSLTAQTRDGDVKLLFDLDERLLPYVSAEDLAELFVGHLDALLDDPAQGFDTVRLTGTDAGRAASIAAERARRHEPRFRTVAEAFFRQSRLTPEAQALSEGDRSLSYAELEARSRAVAADLTRMGIGEGAVVAIEALRSIELVIALLGIMRSGAAFLALEPDLPAERVRHMLRDADPALLLVGRGVNRRPEAGSTRTLDLDHLVSDRETPGEPLAKVRGHAPAYVLYTSGSTGVPKGVVVPHESFARFLDWQIDVVYGPRAFALSFASSVGFDGSLRLFAALVSGGAVRVYPEDRLFHEPALSKVLAEDAVDAASTTPSILRLVLERSRKVKRLRRLVVGGEELTRDLALKVRDVLGPHVDVFNCYGPSEAVVSSACHPFDPDHDRGSTVPIGRAAPDVTLHVLDADGNPVPNGFVGEIHIGGERLGSGYLNLPALTDERFIPDPFAPGRRLYRTGDLARSRPDGSLVYLGRIDNQVKVNGVRTEPGEIEQIILRHTSVRACVVTATKAPKTRLAAFYTADDAIPVRDLRATCARYLPAAMIPASFTRIEAIPLNNSGKVDHTALLAMEEGPASEGISDVPAAPPTTATEQILVRAWEKAFDINGIHRTDDFFALGGDSLVAAAISAEVHARTGVQIVFRVFADHPALNDMARYVDEALATPLAEDDMLARPASQNRSVPISPLQAHFWRAPTAYRRRQESRYQRIARIKGRLNVEAFRASVELVVQRHELLGSRFGLSGGEPVQIFDPACRVELHVIDCSHAPDPETQLQRHASLAAARWLDPTAGPPISLELVRLGDESFAFIVSSAHIIADAQSWTILLRDIGKAYEGIENGETPEWPNLPIRYSEFSDWQRCRWHRDGSRYRTAIARYAQQFGRAPILPDIRSFRRYLRRGPSGDSNPDDARISWVLSRETSQGLDAVGRDRKATPYMVRTAAVAALLASLTGSRKVVIGVVVTARQRPEVRDVFGSFANIVPLAIDVDEEASFRGLVDRVKIAMLNSEEFWDLPIRDLLDGLKLQGVNLSDLPFWTQIAMPLPSMRFADIEAEWEDIVPPVRTDGRLAARFDLQADADRCSLVFDPGLYVKAELQGMADQLVQVIQSAARDPDVPLGPQSRPFNPG